MNAPAPLRINDRLEYQFPRQRQPETVVVRISANAMARLESADRDRVIRSAWVSATDPELIRARDEFQNGDAP